MTNTPHHLEPRAPAWLSGLLALLAAGNAVAADATPKAPAQPPAPTTHVLYMGADLAVEREKAFHAVQEVTATSLVIKPADKPVNLPLEQRTGIRVTEALKLASRSVTIDELDATRAYAVGSDPFEQVTTAAALAVGASAEADLAQRDALQAGMMVGPMAAGLEMARGTPAEGEARAALAGAEARRDAAEAAARTRIEAVPSPMLDPGARAAGLAGDRFDAIRLTFNVTTRERLARPYYAVIAEIRDPGSREGMIRKWVYVKALGPLEAGETRRASVFQGGFTPGYVLEGCAVHVYDGLEELATNLSRKRVPLTDDEAHEYRVIEFLSANKGRTLPAAVAGAGSAGAARSGLTREQLERTCHVRVDKGGCVVAAFRDAAGRQPLADPALESALKALRFMPALAAGRPVESLAPVALGRLPQP